MPETVVANVRTPEAARWLHDLPDTVDRLKARWGLTLGPVFDHADVSCSWVAPVGMSDGTQAVMKLGMPHMEGAHELDGLRFWNGDPTVRLIDFDADLNALLLERCVPGTSLRLLPEPEQDVVIAGLLRRLWRVAPSPGPFRPLTEMLRAWSSEARALASAWPDAGLVNAGLALFEELSRSAPHHVLLATDLHAGNVLAGTREPWLVIDPKPFMGDPAYDATQHLFNCRDRLRRAPLEVIARFSGLLGAQEDRVRMWTFARLSIAPWDGWDDQEWLSCVRLLAP